MPNHVTNQLEIFGPDATLDAIQEQMQWTSQDGVNTAFSFERVFPMPGVLHGTVSGTGVAEGMWLLDEGTHHEVMKSPKHYPGSFCASLESISRVGMPTFASKEEALAWVQKNRPEWLKLGEAAIRAFKETGYCSWYEWCTDKWGTKWDAYQIDVCRGQGVLTYQFDTAWSPPVPVIDKLALLYPSAQFVHRYFDEGHNFWGVSTYVGGQCIECRDSLKEDKVRLCMDLKGYDPEQEEQDECVN